MGHQHHDVRVRGHEVVQRAELRHHGAAILAEHQRHEARAVVELADLVEVPGDVADEQDLAPVGEPRVDDLAAGRVAGGLEQHEPDLAAVHVPVERRDPVHEGGHLAEQLRPDQPAADDHERQELRFSPRVGFDVGALDSYLRERVDGYRGPLEVEQFKGGQSNPTFLLKTPHARYVMRAKPAPAAKLLPSAHAVDREYRVITALGGVGMPVPRTFALCEDEGVVGRAFYVMEFVDGRVLWDQALPGMSRAERGALYDEMNRVIARLHAVDYKAIGLETYGKPGNYFARQIDRWTKQYRASATEPILPLREVESRHILGTLQRVRGNRTEAAKLLGISVRCLQYKLKAYAETDAVPSPVRPAPAPERPVPPLARTQLLA